MGRGVPDGVTDLLAAEGVCVDDCVWVTPLDREAVGGGVPPLRVAVLVAVNDGVIELDDEIDDGPVAVGELDGKGDADEPAG